MTPERLAEKIKTLHAPWHGERGPCSFEGCETEPCPTLRDLLTALREALEEIKGNEELVTRSSRMYGESNRQ